jgi:hypothetical protein
MSRMVTEAEFRLRLQDILLRGDFADVGCVTGPGRSGAVAAVYSSHILHIPFIPYGAATPHGIGRLLIVDTAEQSGKTMRKALRKYRHSDPVAVTVFKEPPRVLFWYESRKPQRYRHERRLAA